jgi:methyltransferase type 12
MKSIWDFWANYYNKLWVQKYSLKPSRDKVINIIKKTGIDRGSLLDMGCGTGQLLEQIHKEFGNKFLLSGADYSVNMIKQARRNLKIKGIEAELFNTDVSDIKENIAEDFDIITCTHSLPYYKNQKKALLDMADLLKEKGYIIVICASVNNFYDRLACSLLKLTTGKAHYPSVKELKSFAKDKLRFMGSCRIKKVFFMPNIVAVVYKRK